MRWLHRQGLVSSTLVYCLSLFLPASLPLTFLCFCFSSAAVYSCSSALKCSCRRRIGSTSYIEVVLRRMLFSMNPDIALEEECEVVAMETDVPAPPCVGCSWGLGWLWCKKILFSRWVMDSEPDSVTDFLRVPLLFSMVPRIHATSFSLAWRSLIRSFTICSIATSWTLNSCSQNQHFKYTVESVLHFP